MSSSSSVAADAQRLESAKRDFIAFLEMCPDNTASSTDLKEHFGMERYITDCVSVINALACEDRIDLKRLHPDQPDLLSYKLLNPLIQSKLKNNDQKNVYAEIEAGGNKGIWVRDIKTNTLLTTPTLTKILNYLEKEANLIKRVNSVTSKVKKLYMLVDIEPSKELTGGPWYSEGSFDEIFIEVMSHYIVTKVFTPGQRLSSGQIFKMITDAGISTEPLEEEYVQQLLTMLVYEGLLDERSSGDSRSYSMIPDVSHIISTGMSNVPCGVCPVFDRCHEGGEISPSTCVYMMQWLKAATDW